MDNATAAEAAAALDAARFVADHALVLLLGAIAALSLFITLGWHLLLRHAAGWARGIGRLWQLLLATAPMRALRRRWPWLDARLRAGLTPGVYLALHLLLGFAVLLPCAALFLSLADEIAETEILQQFDLALAGELGRALSSQTLRTLALVTHLGDRDFLTLLGCAVFALLLWRDRITAAGWALATLGNGLLVSLLKSWFQRERPLHEGSFYVADGWSFPSGHSAGAFAVYGMLAYLGLRHLPPPLRLPALLAAVTLVLLIGSSRVMLRVHFFSDVVAGYAVALGWISICIAGLELARRRAGSRR